MKRIYKYLGLGLIIGFAGIQFIPASLNQSSITPKEDLTDFYKAPEPITTLLKISCYDCHSNNTVYPWYNKLQPISFFLERHIKEAKEELNFSEFASYSKRKQKSKLKSVISQIDKGEMPLKAYLIMHGNARLSEADKTLITKWMEKLRDSL